MKREDRNTALIIIAVLIVCTISLVAIAGSLFNIFAPVVNGALEFVGWNVKLANVNYNFTVPKLAANTTTSTSTTTTTPTVTTTSSADSILYTTNRIIPANYSYNFPIPPKPRDDSDPATVGFEDAILQDAELAGYGKGKDVVALDMIIQIPKIHVNSPVVQGLGSKDLLHKGFWIYPSSKPIGQGEVIMLCHRRYFGPYDPRSCWNLDKLGKGDQIYLKAGKNKTLTYRVISTNVFDGGDETIYITSDSENYLKLVTCTPLYSSAQRLVVLAKLEE